jgi:hypothetical protein
MGSTVNTHSQRATTSHTACQDCPERGNAFEPELERELGDRDGALRSQIHTPKHKHKKNLCNQK